MSHLVLWLNHKRPIDFPVFATLVVVVLLGSSFDPIRECDFWARFRNLMHFLHMDTKEPKEGEVIMSSACYQDFTATASSWILVMNFWDPKAAANLAPCSLLNYAVGNILYLCSYIHPFL